MNRRKGWTRWPIEREPATTAVVRSHAPPTRGGIPQKAMHEPDYSWVDRELEEIRAPRKLSPPSKACKRHLKTLARLVFYVACDVHADTEADDQSGLA